jgi:hypothetical protein
MSIAGCDDSDNRQGALRQAVGEVPAWLWFGVGLFVLSVIAGNRALQDADTYWHIAVGQWIIDHRALPTVDVYSFTKHGAPWISSSWLAQVLYAAAYGLTGWAGPVMLASLGIAAAYALLLHILSRHFTPVHATIVVMVATVLSASHFLVRPHVLALPVMVAWVQGLVSASDDRRAPSLWLLPLIALWANLHGGFVLGLALVAPFALDALWNANADQRLMLAVRWAAFGVCALVASCLTPYGWHSLLAARQILDLGGALALIPEWQPIDFSHLDVFEIGLLAALALVFWRGIVLSPPRILLVLGLLHMALSHTRNIEVLALLAPLVLAKPLAAQLAPAALARTSSGSGWIGSAVVVALAGMAMVAFTARYPYSPMVPQTPTAAVEVLKARKAQRIFHGPGFGGYLIWSGVPVFIDGRAELYGERFVVDALHALMLKNVGAFLSLLDSYRIDAVLLSPAALPVQLFDRLDGWERVHADDKAVVYLRNPAAVHAREPRVKAEGVAR